MGSVPSQIPLPPPPTLIPTLRPRTASFLQRGARRRGHAPGHPAARSHVRALIPRGREEERRLGIDSELSVEPVHPCVRYGTLCWEVPATPASPVPSAAPRCVVSGQQRPQVSERAERAGRQCRGVDQNRVCRGQAGQHRLGFCRGEKQDGRPLGVFMMRN